MHIAKDGRMILIRKAARRDLDGFVRLWQAVADERKYIMTERVSPDQKSRWRKAMDDHSTLMAVAESDGRIVGMLTLGRYGEVKKTKHVRNLGMAVAKRFRGIGVGRALMEYAIKWAERNGVKKISLSVFSENEPAIKLYEKLGFESEGRRKKQFLIDGRYVDELMMGLFV